MPPDAQAYLPFDRKNRRHSPAVLEAMRFPRAPGARHNEKFARAPSLLQCALTSQNPLAWVLLCSVVVLRVLPLLSHSILSIKVYTTTGNIKRFALMGMLLFRDKNDALSEAMRLSRRQVAANSFERDGFCEVHEEEAPPAKILGD